MENFYKKHPFFHVYARYTKVFPHLKKVAFHGKLSDISTEIHNVVLCLSEKGYDADAKIKLRFTKEAGYMDIPSLSMSMAQTNLLTDVGTAMLAKSMEQADIITASMTEMLDASAMELSVNPDIGGNIDISV